MAEPKAGPNRFQPKGFWIGILLIVGLVILNTLPGLEEAEIISYSEFVEALKTNKVKEVSIGSSQIVGTYKTKNDKGATRFLTTRVDPVLSGPLPPSDAKIIGQTESTIFRDLLSWIIPVLLLGLLWMFMIRKMNGGRGGGLMSIGKSRARVHVESDTKVSFKDVAGLGEAQSEVEEIVHFLKSPAEFGRLGGRMPKGILLVGPPGTGKTLLAKAVAGEAGVPFFSISGSEFVEMFVGVGAARVRDLFEQARQKAPCIIFIDELDALGKARSQAGYGGGHDEREQTLNQVLVEMDGFDSAKGLVILAATNRPEILDRALLRPGRFDRQVLVDRPDRLGRLEILKVHLKKLTKVDPELDLESIAALSTGFSGADIANLINEAALVATRRKAEQVELRDFSEAVDRIVAGIERRGRVMNQKERKIVAYHEMGHAIVGATLPSSSTVRKVSIIPRGMGALGYTIRLPTEDRFIQSKLELEGGIAMLLGGRLAEMIEFKETSTGAADDLSRATDMARSIIMRYGMDQDIGLVNYENPDGHMGAAVMPARIHSEQTAREIDLAVKKVLDEAAQVAESILRREWAIVKEAAETLLEKETLDEQDLKAYFSRLKGATPTAEGLEA